MSATEGTLQNMESIKEITELVKLLRQNGDKVLNASSKLSLSTTLLHNLNDAFCLIVEESDISESFQVCNSSKIDIFRDLKFLHDFVQKTIGLKVTNCSFNNDIPVDITKFRHLKYLELKKVCISLVKGIQSVRGQLESVICSGKKGVSKVDQLLATCGGDVGTGFVWGSLKHLALPHNALEHLDMSLELAPWLQILDLNHNLITTAQELECLHNLKYVNLGYNKLEVVPSFNKAVMHCLQVLVLKNNYIENINGLQHLECLIELDLSFNCLTEHVVLWPLEKMAALLWVSLEGNPLSYHPKHRMLTIKHLHQCLVDSKFVLDHLPLSRSEKLLISENRVNSIGSMQIASPENVAAFSNSTNSNIAFECDDKSDPHICVRKAQILELDNSTEKYITKSRKKANVKEAVIAEDNQEAEKFKYISDNISTSYLETSQDHLETKKQIVALREKFGENNWLSSHAGTFVQDIMGLQPTLPLSLPSSIASNNSIHTTTPVQPLDRNQIKESIEDTSNQKQSFTKEINKTSVEYTEQEVKEQEEKVETKEEIMKNVKVDIIHSKNNDLTNTLVSNSIGTSTATYDSEEEKGDLYLVQRKKNVNEIEELFLVITPEDIKERDAVTGKVKYHWSIDSVLSCVLGRGVPITVDIIFDSVRKDKQNRRYFVEQDDAKKIVTTIGERMSVRPITLKVFKCMKCSTHFSQDSEYTAILTTSTSGARQIKCPTCGSSLVIQTDDLSATEREGIIEKSTELQGIKDNCPGFSSKSNLRHSESFSSIGSATSLEESRESTPSASAMTKKCESDIEVLSNPSQSSIEVLDETARTTLTPSRKQSSEEHHTALAPSLLIIPDTIPLMTGLTESSSSGSLTDSICTAYENRIIKQHNSIEKPNEHNVEKETLFTPVTNLTSMLGGLLQSIKIGNNKTFVRTEGESNISSSNVQYSYTDFNNVDHRVKLHIILNIFEHENEELIFLLRADILIHSLKEVFPGCLVLSTSKVYVLRISGIEGEDPQCWLHKEVSWTTDRLRSFAPLPFKQGILIELEQPNKLTEEHCSITISCLLQDFQRTSNFLYYITDLSLPVSCEVEFSVPKYLSTRIHNLLATIKGHQDIDAVRLLALFSLATLKRQDCNMKLKFSGLIITSSIFVIMEDNMQWLLPGSNEIPVVAKEQIMSNLIDIELSETTLTLNFLDEIAGVDEIWILQFVSTGAAEVVINSIRPSWEELFSVPLQITVKTAENTKKT